MTVQERHTTIQHAAETVAEQLTITGQVQGVGFRPFVYRLAQQHGIHGWVKNTVGQVIIHAEGSAQALQVFKQNLISQAPPLAKPFLQQSEHISPCSEKGFTILSSDLNSEAQIHLPPDYYLCPDCLRELFDKNDRRYRYPFINCTQCGPRYTLIRRLPYDRQYTTMAEFTLCPACRKEYSDPLDRRFHAEPIACPVCGPQLQFYASSSGLISNSEQALQATINALQNGEIVAVKGIGGYHLLCDARNNQAVLRLRENKPRPDKPLALMFPISDKGHIDGLDHYVNLDKVSLALLQDAIRPIVLLKKKPHTDLAEAIAPGLDEVGVLLPYSPLHALLSHEFAGPLVATSANISGEPVMTNNQQVEQRLGKVADAFLHHNRPIERPADDSVYRIINNTPRPLRLGRGVAPLEIPLPITLNEPVLATGGHMKNTIALAWGDRIVLSPHIGDLDTPRSLEVFQQVCGDLQQLYQVRARHIVCDAHPGYASSRWARQQDQVSHEVLHHHAHASAIAGEYAHESNWLVFAWDGTGYGNDYTLWGGETFYGRAGQWQRIASLRSFKLPGGDRASREPWRAALSLCWEAKQHCTLEDKGHTLLYKAWQQNLNSPTSSAMGRLFDAAAALTGICQQASFEGQAPMLLEAMARQSDTTHYIKLPINKQDELWRSDWSVLLPMLMDTKLPVTDRAACFHHSLAQQLLQQCQLFREQYGDFAVGLGGGVFQNRLLTELSMDLLQESGFRVYLPTRLPCNDGGLSFGQLIEFAARQTQSNMV